MPTQSVSPERIGSSANEQRPRLNLVRVRGGLRLRVGVVVAVGVGVGVE